ncbi:MAG: TonB-dependent receptor [Novosphingobium sp.]
MNLKYLLAASTVAMGISALSGQAVAQSTGSIEFDEDIVVTAGRLTQDVAGISVPDTAKAKAVLTSDHIQRQNPGQTVLDTINIVPGVNFTNNDAYGSAGGQLTIRGFSADRVSLTFDGIPLNDSGNYAIYSSQQMDPELIEQVNVNLGTTDVDSPTAAATGSTVNYRTRNPREDLGGMVSGSVGQFNMWRVFGVIDTGTIGNLGTRAFISASRTKNDNPYNNYGRIAKMQLNAKIYQPIGSNGDFISIAGHYNESRNNFFGSLPLRLDTTQSSTNSAPRIVGSGSGNRFPITNGEREYLINFPCTVNSAATPGSADTPNSCGTEFDRRYNPSNTGNIRINSRFSLSDNVTLTVDPSYQYVKANGGGTVGARERLIDVQPGSGVTNVTGYVGGRPYFGRDLNGDGDLLDEVTMIAPSQTQTHRYGLIANLSWRINDDHSVRVGYTFDRARHRQTGQVALVKSDGEPVDVFAVNVPQSDATGAVLQKRDRISFAILHQISGEYRGQFMDGNLVVTAGLRAPFFKRDLNNFCFTTSDTGFVDCFGSNTAANTTYAALNPTVQGPQQRVLKYNRVLPNIGAVFKVGSDFSVFANYSKGLQVPGTDTLYNAFFFPANTESAKPRPETTDNFDLGFRYRNNKVQAQASIWYTKYNDRLASAYDPDTDRNLYRNLGSVEKYGIDGSIAWQPMQELSIYLFGSWMKSKIQDNVQAGLCNAAQVSASQLGCTAVGNPAFYQTKGKREAGAPEYTLGASARGTIGPVEIGVIAKRTGGRFIYDTNEPLVFSGREVYPAQTNAYWLVNLDARFNLSAIGLNEKSYLQLNVYNLFDTLYVGNFTTAISPASSPPFAQIGAPRTVSGTLVFAF